jgi:hypothetical protein
VLDHGARRGKTSGVELPDIQSEGAHLFRILDGKVSSLVNYWNRERAFADLRLDPEGG